MKKIFIALFVLASFELEAQDTTKVKNLQLQAKLIEYVITICMNPDNDSLFQVYQDLRAKFRINNPPQNNQMVTIDSIPTIELANLYNYTLSNSEGFSMANNMRTQIAAARLANSYLERECAKHELFWTTRLDALRLSGRKILRGK